jgi:hypothetical protein
MVKRRRKSPRQAAQLAANILDATPQRLAKAEGAHRVGEDKVRRINDWPLAVLHAKRILARDQHENDLLYAAGERFCETYLRAQVEARAQDISSDRVSGSHRAMPFSLSSAEARDELRMIREKAGNRIYKPLELIAGQGKAIGDCYALVAEYAPGDMAKAVLLERLRTGLLILTEVYGWRTSGARSNRSKPH